MYQCKKVFWKHSSVGEGYFNTAWRATLFCFRDSSTSVDEWQISASMFENKWTEDPFDVIDQILLWPYLVNYITQNPNTICLHAGVRWGSVICPKYSSRLTLLGKVYQLVYIAVQWSIMIDMNLHRWMMGLMLYLHQSYLFIFK